MSQRACFNAESPCLSVNWSEDNKKVFVGCVSGVIKEFHVESGIESVVGEHSKPVKDVYWLSATNTLCSVSFDQTVKFWDLRQSGHVNEIKLGYKPQCSDLFENKLVLGLSNSRVTLVDVLEAQKARDYQREMRYMECQLSRVPYSSIKFLADGSGIFVSSDEGKCNISKFRDETLDNVMIFKAHRKDEPGRVQLVYPTNCVFINKKFPDFVGTCGGDGKLTFWDYKNKGKIRDLNMEAPVTYGEMSPDASLLASATGEDWSRGIGGYLSKRTEVHVQVMNENKPSKAQKERAF